MTLLLLLTREKAYVAAVGSPGAVSGLSASLYASTSAAEATAPGASNLVAASESRPSDLASANVDSSSAVNAAARASTKRASAVVSGTGFGFGVLYTSTQRAARQITAQSSVVVSPESRASLTPEAVIAAIAAVSLSFAPRELSSPIVSAAARATTAPATGASRGSSGSVTGSSRESS